MDCFTSVYYLFFNNFYLTSYLKVYWTDLHKIFRLGRTVIVNGQSEISSSVL